LRPKKPLAEIPQLALVVGVALADMVAQYTDLDIILKWPNDVLVNGKKCAGILLETGRKDQCEAWSTYY